MTLLRDQLRRPRWSFSLSADALGHGPCSLKVPFASARSRPAIDSHRPLTAHTIKSLLTREFSRLQRLVCLGSCPWRVGEAAQARHRHTRFIMLCDDRAPTGGRIRAINGLACGGHRHCRSAEHRDHPRRHGHAFASHDPALDRSTTERRNEVVINVAGDRVVRIAAGRIGQASKHDGDDGADDDPGSHDTFRRIN